MTANVSSGSLRNLSIGQESVFGTVATPTSLQISVAASASYITLNLSLADNAVSPCEAICINALALAISS